MGCGSSRAAARGRNRPPTTNCLLSAPTPVNTQQLILFSAQHQHLRPIVRLSAARHRILIQPDTAMDHSLCVRIGHTMRRCLDDPHR